MTKRKVRAVRVDATAWQRIEEQLKRVAAQIDHLGTRLVRLEDEANSRLHAKEPGGEESPSEVINGMARARHQEGARRHATPGGPNFPDDIYPPGCGPMQLVWATIPSQNPTLPDSVSIGWQGDSFHHFPSRMAAVNWLLHIAQRIIIKPPQKA